MRRVHLPCRLPTVMLVVLATALGMFGAIAVLLAGPSPIAAAEAQPLSISARQMLSQVDQSVDLAVSGRLSTSLDGAQLELVVSGPVDIDQVGQTGIQPPEAGRVSFRVGGAPVVTPPAGDTGETTADTSGAAGPVLPPAVLSPGADLSSGTLEAQVALPAGTPARPGAYLLEVQVQVKEEAVASAQIWLGKVADREGPLDVALVLPLSLGIHRDPTGVFFDQVLEKAVAAGGSDPGGLPALLQTFDEFPDLDLTLAPEPMLLTQLREMSDGYTGVDPSGGTVEVGEDDPTAIAAAAALADLQRLADQTRVEVAGGPYAGADLGLIAAQGWRDGLEQVQMGKQELQQTLQLGGPVTGAYSPDLELTSDSLAYYAQASIDHVVVREGLRDDLSEEVGADAVTARARNIDNDRVTLVFSDEVLASVMAEPWDGSLFGAALAADLAVEPRDALVISLDAGFSLPPASYVESIGNALSGVDWIRPQTLTALIRAHSPGTRPVLLQTAPYMAQGYVEESLLAALVDAHAAVTDIASIADTTRTPVDSAHRLLAVAESRWWSRAGISPVEADIGLEYAGRAQALAQGEMERVRFVGVGSTFFTGGEGIVEVTIENTAAYPMNVELRLEGRGVEFHDGDSIKVELPTGNTEFPLEVAREEGGQPRVTATLVAGTSVLDEFTFSLRFLRLWTILPWLIAGVVVIAAGTYLLIRRVARRRNGAKI